MRLSLIAFALLVLSFVASPVVGSDDISSSRLLKRRGKGNKRRSKLRKCAQAFMGTHLYGGSCEKTYVVTIGCNKKLEECFYQEVSVSPSSRRV